MGDLKKTLQKISQLNLTDYKHWLTLFNPNLLISNIFIGKNCFLTGFNDIGLGSSGFFLSKLNNDKSALNAESYAFILNSFDDTWLGNSGAFLSKLNNDKSALNAESYAFILDSFKDVWLGNLGFYLG